MIRKNQEEQNYLTYGQLNLITSSRFNWALLAAWTREYIHSVAGGLNNVKDIGDRLYRVPVDFYNLVLPFVGKANADRVLNITSLRQITLMSLITAMKNNDVETVNANTIRLYQLADELAIFLAQINPYWSQETWRSLFYQNIRMNLDLASSYMSGDYERDIALYDELLQHSSVLGDEMARGMFRFLATHIAPVT
jgi:hypothetical protein